MTLSSLKPKRVLLAGLFHETHTFLDGYTGLVDFTTLRGGELLAAAGDASPLAGVVEAAQGYGWDIVPAIDMRAMPSAMVTDEVMEAWWAAFEPVAKAALEEGVDGIYLVLHGAMASQSCVDVEGELLERIAHLLAGRAIPVCGVTDLHANFSARMAGYSQGLVTYRKNPHTDAKEAAVRAAGLLDDIMARGVIPATYFAHPPIMWPPTGTGTADEPMCSLEELARCIEENHSEILAVNVHAGFSFADTPDTGVSFSVVTTGTREMAERELGALSALAMEMKTIGNVIEPPIEAVMPLLANHSEGPIILVEPSDNVGGGAPGDGTGVLKALVAHGIENAVVIINDPEAAGAAAALLPGEKLTLDIGGKGSRLSGGPIRLEVELVSASDGHFDLEDEHSHMASMSGLHIDMGKCAVVRHRGIQILLTSSKTAPMDLGQLRSQGIEPEKLFAIGVKAAVAHRRAYDPIARHSYYVGTPGPCSSDLRTLPFRHIERPVYPLDE